MHAEYDDYFAYLSGRSRLGHLYRRLWLYPAICRQVQGSVLDVGCGIGDMLRFRPGTVGVDINPATVAHCVRNGLDAHVMDVDRLPFQGPIFDGVILDNVLEHIADPQPLLSEIRRVLRPAGTLIAGVPGTRGFAADPDHKRFYDEAALTDALGHAGFDLCRLLRMPLPFEFLSARLRAYCLYGVFSRRGDG